MHNNRTIQISTLDGQQVKNVVKEIITTLHDGINTPKCPTCSNNEDGAFCAFIPVDLETLAHHRTGKPLVQYARFRCGCVHKVVLRPLTLPANKETSVEFVRSLQ
jgi:hypothetical protein